MSVVLDHRTLQKTIKEVNSQFGTRLRFITTRGTLLQQIKEDVGDLIKKNEDQVSDFVKNVYYLVLQLPPEGAKMKEEQVAMIEEGFCEAYGVDYAPEDPECQNCEKTTFCKELTEKHKEAAKEPEPKKVVLEPELKVETVEKTKPAKGKPVAGTSRYGHKIGSSAQFMDDLLWDGGMFDSLVSELAEAYGKTEASAKSKLRSHIVWLKKEKGITFEEKDGKIKAVEEHI